METCPDCNGKKVMVYSCCTGEPVYNESMICPKCRELLGEEPCVTCNGTGEVENNLIMNKHEEILSKYEELDGFVTYQNALKAMQEVEDGCPRWVKVGKDSPSIVECDIVFRQKNGGMFIEYVEWDTKIKANGEYYEWLEQPKTT